MAQPFSFGFSGDDIEIDPDDVQETSHVTECGVEAPESSGPPPLKPQKHDIEELVGKRALHLDIFHLWCLLFCHSLCHRVTTTICISAVIPPSPANVEATAKVS